MLRMKQAVGNGHEQLAGAEEEEEEENDQEGSGKGVESVASDIDHCFGLGLLVVVEAGHSMAPGWV